MSGLQMGVAARRQIGRGALALGLALVVLCAQAQNLAEPDYQGVALKWAKAAAAGAVPSTTVSLHLDVAVGPIDTRLHLAPCSAMEAYLPPGSHLWGRSRVGLRCVDGAAKWNISLPLTVKAVGKAWVVRSQVAPGAVLTPSDVIEADVDWAEESSPVLQEAGSWVGAIATRALTTGQTLRQGMVKAAQVFQAGAQVRVIAEGAGFQASSEAEALSAGVMGQPARVRMDNGRIATGVVLDARTVKMEL